MMAASRATIPMMSIAREVCTPSLPPSFLPFSPLFLTAPTAESKGKTRNEIHFSRFS